MNPRYQLIIVRRAFNEIESIYQWITSENPDAADKWRDGLFEAIKTLQYFPEACASIPDSLYERKHLRQLIYGRKRHNYRILFEIRGRTVYIRRIVHSARMYV